MLGNEITVLTVAYNTLMAAIGRLQKLREFSVKGCLRWELSFELAFSENGSSDGRFTHRSSRSNVTITTLENDCS